MSNAVAHADHGHAHAAHHPALQHHFDTMAQQKEAAVIGMWVFLLTEILFFGGLFVAYMIYRVWYFDAFAEASRSLDLFWGGLNTAVLIGSSLTMAMAVRCGADQQAQGDRQLADPHDDPRLRVPRREGDRVRGQVRASPRAGRRTSSGPRARSAGAAGGEQAAPRPAQSIAQLSLTPEQLQHTTQIYFSLYFTMTGLHALHMIIGVGLMLVITWMAWKGKFDARVLHAGRDERPLLALRRHRLDLPVPAALPRREAQRNVGSRFADQPVRHDLPGADGPHRRDRGRGVRRPGPVQLRGRDGDRRLQGVAGGAGTSCT